MCLPKVSLKLLFRENIDLSPSRTSQRQLSSLGAFKLYIWQTPSLPTRCAAKDGRLLCDDYTGNVVARDKDEMWRPGQGSFSKKFGTCMALISNLGLRARGDAVSFPNAILARIGPRALLLGIPLSLLLIERVRNLLK
jgi:hypothetical protein